MFFEGFVVLVIYVLDADKEFFCYKLEIINIKVMLVFINLSLVKKWERRNIR